MLCEGSSEHVEGSLEPVLWEVFRTCFVRVLQNMLCKGSSEHVIWGVFRACYVRGLENVLCEGIALSTDTWGWVWLCGCMVLHFRLTAPISCVMWPSPKVQVGPKGKKETEEKKVERGSKAPWDQRERLAPGLALVCSQQEQSKDLR